jgi:transposase
VFRALAANPDRIVASVAERCPHCDHALTLADQSGFHAYDHIELPPIRPVITRLHRHRGVCPSCRRGFSAPPPAGMPPASPFGPELVALILHLHVTQAIGFERLVRLLDEVFGICISEGAIANMLARAGTPLAAAAETTAAEVRSSRVVASDETSARVEGKNWWQWVLLSSTAVHHLIADSRGAAVLTDFLGETKPDVWVADRYAAQAGHGNERQLCLAHLLRDAQYAIDTGDTGFAPGFYKLLQRAVAIGRRRPDLKSLPRRKPGTPPWSSTVPTSTAGLTGCSPSAPPPRPADSSPAVSANAAVISLSSSPAAMCPPPTTNASVPCGPA